MVLLNSPSTSRHHVGRALALVAGIAVLASVSYVRRQSALGQQYIPSLTPNEKCMDTGNIYTHSERYRQTDRSVWGDFSFTSSHYRQDPVDSWAMEGLFFSSTTEGAVTVCTTEWTDADGHQATHYLTKVGPFTIMPGKRIELVVLPAGPMLSSDSAAFMTQVSKLLRFDNGVVAGQPPIHYHHLTMYTAGVPDTPISRFSGSTVNSKPSWSASGLFFGPNNLANSPPCAGKVKCLMQSMSRGFGYMKTSRMDYWEWGWADNIGMEPVNVTFEFARTWVVTPRVQDTYQPVFLLKLYSSKEESPFLVPANSDHIVYATFYMPGNGFVLYSGSHLHAGLPTELWVFDRPANEIIPASVTSISNESTVLPATVNGFSRSAVEEKIILPNQQFLRCKYESRVVVINGIEYPENAKLASANSCNGWTFKKGQALTLFAYMSSLPTPFHMHVEFEVGMVFDEATYTPVSGTTN
ncbi:hypothetical protein AB1Y20_006570 [Prymnesium parvum]|uniref:Amine oxidase n=1 Tax=Prymnesium parvum TaxID=97485 RepID=A0AB34J111_PRYPA|mmetsp:Transcript_42739/g.106383  ORF Transcript_42739/g.106383 Transcript_42739/m.106383 type:complete len:468 (+) Transcript_42739:44-1447(+)